MTDCYGEIAKRIEKRIEEVEEKVGKHYDELYQHVERHYWENWQRTEWRTDNTECQITEIVNDNDIREVDEDISEIEDYEG